MKASITDFKSRLETGGVRPTMFYVQLTLPNGNNYVGNGKYRTALESFSFLCKASQIPGQQITPMTVGLPAGQSLKIPGSRIFEPWNTKVILDGNMEIRQMIEQWAESIIGYETPRGVTHLDRYMSSATVHQLDRQGEKIRSYELRHLWPNTISPMELAYDPSESVHDFDVSWSFQYFTPVKF